LHFVRSPGLSNLDVGLRFHEDSLRLWIHVVAAFFLQQFGDPVATAITTFYESWPTQLFVYFCILYHAINGGRVALMDLFPRLLRYQHELVWLQWAIFTPAYLVPAFYLIRSAWIPV